MQQVALDLPAGDCYCPRVTARSGKDFAVPTCRLAAMLLLVASAAQAQDFRIATKIYVGDAKEPVQENLTLFSGSVVYDVVATSPREVTVFDPRLEYFSLLDVERKVQTRIPRKLLLEFVAQIKVKSERGGSVVQEAGNPRFNASFDERLSRLTLDGKAIDYTAQGEVVDRGLARRYFQFVDMFARLNATRPGALPPFARLELNRELSARNLVPTMVERTLRPSNPLARGGITARSEHQLSRRLLESDRQEIEAAGRYLQQFEVVTFDVYRKLDK